MTDSTELADALRGALAPRATLIHPTYRHLSRALTIAGLNVAQWLVVLCGVAATWAMSAVLPLAPQWSFSVAGSLVGVPAAVLFVLCVDGDFDARPIVRGVVSWRRSARVLLPIDGGRPPAGYRLSCISAATPTRAATTVFIDDNLEDLWSV